MRSTVLLSTLVVLAACDGAVPAPQGPARFGLANNDQAAPVSQLTQQYAKPVVGKVVRSPGGGIALRLVTPAYADTTILNGSPVAGAVVCMDAPAEGGPAPSQLCNNTAADGTVPFFYRSGTKAGEYVYHANATVDGVPIQPDSAHFVQVPGPVAHNEMWTEVSNVNNGEALWLKENLFEDAYHNVIAYTLTASGAFQVVTDAGNGTRGIKPTSTAVAGDTGTLVFARGDTVIVQGVATLKPGQVSTTWGVTFAAE